ncbi:MAG TPA: DUF2891 domain-containing protein [Sediminibacterium sp.]|nr:DUF2891 domain-containing protein [Sediminibacterium sp.]
MKRFFIVLLNVTFVTAHAQDTALVHISADSSVIVLTQAGASHLAALPLKCLQQEYPNKTSHTINGDGDQLKSPRQLHPAFYGCFDWHSDVHGHWMLVRLLKLFPDMPESPKIRTAIGENITPEHIRDETAYFGGILNRTYERTYGWAWLLQLQNELRSWQDTEGQQWAKTLQPLCDTVISLWMQFLPKQTYANRTGVHPNTAFGLVLALDYARASGNKKFESALLQSAKKLYGNDRSAPARWEPDGTDFLSPSLEEADLMRRVLDKASFGRWLHNWISPEALAHLTRLPVISDRSDYQIVHLDGLCFSRSWCMRGIASALSPADPYQKILQKASVQHLVASLPHIASGSYGGEHWLASFAVYALQSHADYN